MDAQIGHVTGLPMLRERGTPLPLYTTDAVWNDLSTGFPITSILSHYCGVEHRRIALDGEALSVPELPHVRIDALPLSSKASLIRRIVMHRKPATTSASCSLTNRITNVSNGKRAFYAPGLCELEPHILQAMHQADLLLVDGTVWTDDEIIRLGLAKKTSKDMGHLAQSGASDMIEVLESIDRADGRKVLIHINNTNPILIEDGPERRMLTERDIEVAHDGMSFER